MAGDSTKYFELRGLAAESPDEIRRAQSAFLAEHLRYLSRNSRYYGELLSGVDPDAVSLGELPTTDKTALESDPEAFLAVSMDEIVDTVTTSGTSGSPVDFHFTKGDLERLAYNETRALSICGIRRSDVVLLTCTLDRCFIAGLAYHSGCVGIGAAAIRAGASPMETHLSLISRLGVTVIVGVPSFLLKLAGFAESTGVAPESLGVERLVCIGEPLRDADMNPLPVCVELERSWSAEAFSTYASTETTTAFCECAERKGGHLLPELGMVEILDDSGRVLPAGEVGEIVVTPFHIEGMPLLRYRTGDIGFLIEEACPCGLNSPRLSPILGRKHQMIKCKGTKFYPGAVSSVLDGVPEVLEYQIRVFRSDLSDDVEVALALSDEAALDLVERKLAASLRVGVVLKLEPLNELRRKVFPSTSRKPLRFVSRDPRGSADLK